MPRIGQELYQKIQNKQVETFAIHAESNRTASLGHSLLFCHCLTKALACEF